MYKMESRYKLWGGRILVQITPLQDFGAEMEVGLSSEYYGTCKSWRSRDSWQQETPWLHGGYLKEVVLTHGDQDWRSPSWELQESMYELMVKPSRHAG